MIESMQLAAAGKIQVHTVLDTELPRGIRHSLDHRRGLMQINLFNSRVRNTELTAGPAFAAAQTDRKYVPIRKLAGLRPTGKVIPETIY